MRPATTGAGRALRRVAVFLSAALSLGLCACWGEAPTFGDDLQAAREAAADRQWTQAERLLGRHLRNERDPESRWKAWNELLVVINAGGADPRASFDYLEAMLEEFADDDARCRDILMRMGLLADRLRLHARAAEIWSSWLGVAGAQDSEDAVLVHRRLAAAFFVQRRFDASEEVLEQCLSLPAGDEAKSLCTYDLADQNLARGRWETAANLARQIVDDGQEPKTRALAGFVLADALEQLGDGAGALAQFEGIRESYPNADVVENRILRLRKKMKK